MHESSMKNMDKFIADHIADRTGKIVLDVGSRDVNGNYRGLFEGWDYIGMDVVPGANVDIVMPDPWRWWTFSDECVDVVVSGQCFEHMEFPERAMEEISRILKVGGMCCIISPSGGDPDHGYQKFKVKDFQKLAKDAGLDVESCYVDKESDWKDCVLIAEKKERTHGADTFGKRSPPEPESD